MGCLKLDYYEELEASTCERRRSREIFGSRQNSRSGVEFEYIAFGEVLFEEHQGSFKTPYLFNGKELDRETNLSYYSARYLDMKTSLWLSVDEKAEKHSNIGGYVYCFNNPLKYVDPDGKDGIIIIKGNNITISSNVHLYGAGATKAVVAQMQKDINAKWGGSYNTKSSDGKKSFNVNVKVNIGLYKGKEKNNSMIIPESWNPDNRDNFIKVGAGSERSYVTGGDEGEWRSQGRSGMSLAKDDPAPHEVGHLLGLDDRYTDTGGVNKGWENNLMGDSKNGKVEQRSIDGVVKDAMKAYEIWSKDKNNAGKEFKYEIDTNRPNKENN